MPIAIALIVIHAIAVIVLAVRLALTRCAFDEIRQQADDKIEGSTQSSIRLTTSDKKARALATDLDRALTDLNEERNKLIAGDRVMRSNITAISHDLRTPLTAINSYSEMLEGELSEEDRREYVSRIRQRAEELGDLTEELFKYSVSRDAQYYSHLSTEPIDLKRLIEEILLSFYKDFEARKITPETSFCEDQVVIEYNRKNAVRVLDNVFGNASKYAADYLKVSLDKDGEIVVVNKASDLTPVQVSHMFDRYYTVDDGKRSTGLGLAIAKELLMESEGSISAEREGEDLVIKIKF